MDDRLGMNLLCGQQREAICQIESHLIAKRTDGASACPVIFLNTVIQDVLEEILIDFQNPVI